MDGGLVHCLESNLFFFAQKFQDKNLRGNSPTQERERLKSVAELRDLNVTQSLHLRTHNSLKKQ